MVQGPEPLGNEFNTPYLHSKLKGKSASIKSALLDQRIVSGLGNIYVCESLWRAGINPNRISGKVTRKKIDVLVPIIRDVLQEAISAGGSSLKDHRQTNGDLGYFQHSFAVYGRDCSAAAQSQRQYRGATTTADNDLRPS